MRPALLDDAMEADAPWKEPKMTEFQLREANEAARLEKEKARALREELKKMKTQLSEANEAARLEKEKGDALREELRKVKTAKVLPKESMKEILEKCL